MPTRRYGPDGTYKPLVIRREMLPLVHAAKLFNVEPPLLKGYLDMVRRQSHKPNGPVYVNIHDVVRVAQCSADEAGDVLTKIKDRIGLPSDCLVANHEGAEYGFAVDFRGSLLFCGTEKERNRLKSEIDWLLGRRRPVPEDSYCRAPAMTVILRSLVPAPDGTVEVDEFELSELLGAPTSAVGYALAVLQGSNVITVERTRRRSLLIRFCH